MEAVLLLLLIGAGVALTATMMGSKRNSGGREAASLFAQALRTGA
jgi:hypothetical protein